MGLLDQILGGLSGGSPAASRTGQSSGSGLLMALLPVVLGMLANRQGAGMADAAAPGMSGASGMGGGMGGLGGLLEQLTRSGFGQQASSWVGTGPNEALPPNAWSQVLEPGQLSAIAAQAGISEDEASTGLSELVPQIVDRLTPQGHLPPTDQLLASVDEYVRQLGR